MYLDKYKLIPLTAKKLVYSVHNEPDLLVKEMSMNEFKIHRKATYYVPCPAIINEIVKDDKLYMVMERIKGKTFYEMYGSNPNNVPQSVWNKAYNIISRLYYNDIHYVDVSPHNFIIDEKGNVFVIDFGDAYECKVNWFLKDFLDGEKIWNPDFE